MTAAAATPVPLPRSVDVLVVGAGPSGLLAANLLVQAGLEVLVIERQTGLNDLPRAVSVDDEAMRALQAAGLEVPARRIILEGTGTKYFGARGQLLTYARSPQVPPFGHAAKNPIDQPEFDAMLLAGLDRSGVSVAFGTELVALALRDDGVDAEVIQRPDVRRPVAARAVIAADGGRSTVRDLLGVEMEGTDFPESWVVIDTVGDPHDQRYAMHHGDPRRPHVIIPGRDGRCRYEFLLRPGDDPDEIVTLPSIRRLLAPYRHGVEDRDVVRAVVYRFYALIADRWRDGRVFLVGDAAHMMPPFAGQGLNSGLRDVFNLAWKLALVLRGRAGEGLLATYEAERRPHAQAMILLSERLGRVVMTTSPIRATLRDLAFGIVRRVPPIRRYFAEMRFKPSPVLPQGTYLSLTDGGGLPGRPLPQPDVLSARGERTRLDEVLGDGVALVGLGGPHVLDHATHAVWDRLAARRVGVLLDDRLPRRDGRAVTVADADGRLASVVGRDLDRVAVVRPDRYVLGTFGAGQEARFVAAMSRLLDLPSG